MVFTRWHFPGVLVPFGWSKSLQMDTAYPDNKISCLVSESLQWMVFLQEISHDGLHRFCLISVCSATSAFHTAENISPFTTACFWWLLARLLTPRNCRVGFWPVHFPKSSSSTFFFRPAQTRCWAQKNHPGKKQRILLTRTFDKPFDSERRNLPRDNDQLHSWRWSRFW